MGSFISSLLGSSYDPSEASPEDSRVLTFHSAPRWQLHFNSVKETPKLIVIDFTATWCGPCRFISPAFSQMSEKYTDVDFVKIDVDKLPDVAREYGVQAMPTFLLLKKGTEVDRVVGAKQDELQRKVEKHRTSLLQA
ncbi:thioredoxin H2 isoform X2 [Cajanus cajan]|uniref:thioredoxin H2 isoform X2 n=1 Tax=Cajanus cajan TaxID=3821 RepID=UPI00098DC951|nr:thioredoxin H2 isoform X2 [Cajanus cajan]